MLFDGTYARGRAAELVSEEAWLQALLDVEAALARANAAAGSVPAEAAERIAAVCRAERFDARALAREAADHATVVVPLVRALRAQVGADDAGFVHLGATSQDVVDSAAMVLAGRALDAIADDLDGAAAAACALAREHRATPMIGRTLLQQALPTTFGLRAAGWMHGLDGARQRLLAVRSNELWVQLGGPVGSGDPRVAAAVARELGLTEPLLPWHTIRLPIAALAGALGATSGIVAKIARDVTLLAQDELGELREGGEGRGGSSAMAHKRNPVAAVSALACARRTPALVATLLASMEQEHERAAGAWQAEWGTLTDLIALSGSAAAWGRDLLERVEVDAERMRRTLDARAGDEPLELADAIALVDRALAARERDAGERGAGERGAGERGAREDAAREDAAREDAAREDAAREDAARERGQ